MLPLTSNMGFEVGEEHLDFELIYDFYQENHIRQ